MSQQNAILAYLTARYPGKLVPYGQYTAVASALDCSRELVSVVARTHGFRTACWKHVCARCYQPFGPETLPDTLLCLACRVVPLVCDECDALFHRMPNALHLGPAATRYTRQGYYCSRRCARLAAARERPYLTGAS